MKVDFSAKLSPYQRSNPGTARIAPPKAAVKTDVASFSRGNTAVSDKRLLGVKSTLQSELSAGAKADRLAELRAQIKDGSYRVPANLLVDSMLEG